VARSLKPEDPGRQYGVPQMGTHVPPDAVPANSGCSACKRPTPVEAKSLIYKEFMK
jgi:hypothetical protein